MGKDFVIELDQVAKKFSKTPGATVKYGLIDVCRTLMGQDAYDKIRTNEFWALNNISFQVKKGEVLGIIGANGSGKSTLLKLLNGIFPPDKGRIIIRGKTNALIAVGAGFHPMLSGRENIYIKGAILGVSKKAMDQRLKRIIEFAQIGDFLDTQVKNYSSGMYVRLGFSIAIHCVPDILLVDEILSVGDVDFQERSIKKMKEIAKSQKSIVFVSHNIEKILSFTQRAIYLKAGQIIRIGKTREVVQEYLEDQQRTK